MNRLIALAAVSALATLLFVASFLLKGIESPLTWATIAAWAVADTALVATMVGQTRTNHRPTPQVAKGRPPGERRAAADLAEMIELVMAQRSTDIATGTTVVLLATGRNKIAVIKVLREALQTGLREAKELADAADRSPAIVATGLGPAEAERLLRELHAAGARAEVH